MEISKQKDLENKESEDSGNKGLKYERPTMAIVIKRVVQGVLLNPIVIMTALGICGNLVFSHQVPTIIEGILKVINFE